MIIRKKQLFSIVCATILAMLLIGCGCNHEWQRATCQTPRTCSRCGETEGKIRSHEWGSTDCRAPEGCIVCGTLEGIELTHEWQKDCKICIYCGYDERPADDRFLELLVAGLEQRWQLEEALQETKDYVLTKEDWAAFFAAEYDQLRPFREEKFQDKALEDAAVRYIRSLEDSQKALEYFGTEQWKDAYYNSAYHAQTVALLYINNLRPIMVSEDYAKKLENMLINGEIIDLVQPLFDQVLFLDIGTVGNTKKFETTLKNTSSLTFRWFSFDVELKDGEGQVMETKTIKVLNWKPDEKKRFQFSTTIDFVAMNVTFADWELLQ